MMDSGVFFSFTKILSEFLRTLFILSFMAQVAHSIIDNEIVGNPVVNCEETMVSITFKTKKPFNGRVYVQGMAEDERCSRNFASNADQSKFSMMIQNGDCTMQRQRVTGSLEGIMLSLTIVVSFHGTFVTRSDRAYRCMCFFKNVKQLTNAIDVNLIGTTELIDTAKTPSCVYSIHAQSPDGPPVSLGKVGDKIFHVWHCDDPTHSFLVHSCSVDDGRGSKFDLLDVDGCAIDPIIQPDVIYDKERNKASVETFGYKFSDTTILNYQCTVELCKKSTNECQGITPPICGRQKRNILIKPSNNKTHGEIKMDLMTSLSIMETVYGGDTGMEITPKTIYENKTTEIVEELSQQYNSTTDSPISCFRSLLIGFGLSLALATIFSVCMTLQLFKRSSIFKDI